MATDEIRNSRLFIGYPPPWLPACGDVSILLVNAGARTNYQRYLDLRAQATSPDPLAADARQRLAR